MNCPFFKIMMSAKMASTLAVRSVVTLQGATIALADQDTILMATLEHAKVCATFTYRPLRRLFSQCCQPKRASRKNAMLPKEKANDLT